MVNKEFLLVDQWPTARRERVLTSRNPVGDLRRFWNDHFRAEELWVCASCPPFPSILGVLCTLGISKNTTRVAFSGVAANGIAYTRIRGTFLVTQTIPVFRAAFLWFLHAISGSVLQQLGETLDDVSAGKQRMSSPISTSYVTLLSLFLLLISRACCQQCSNASRNDTQALLSFKDSLSDPLEIWSSGDLKSWKGVHWGSNGQVEGLNLSDQRLKGNPYPVWNELSSLISLDLSWNNISGTLNVSNCVSKKLKVLNLSRNSFQGRIPDEIFRVESLEELDLSGNNFSDKLPEINLPSLRLLNLSMNNLTGDVRHLNASLKLEELDISHNIFTGAIPTSISQLQALKVLNLSFNHLTGRIPEELGQLSNLTRLLLSDNHLEGSIPGSLGNCRKLFQIDVSKNNLTGGIPSNLGKLPELSILALGYNLLSGELDFNTNTFQSLESLFLPRNRLQGNVSSLGNLAKIKKVVLQGNSLTGPIPGALGNCTFLEEVWLDLNGLSGSIPDDIFRLRKLKYLALGNNHLSGPIPAGLSECTSLEVLWLEQNEFTGELPAELGNLPHLLMISVAGNQLVGNVPSEFSKLKSLIGLDMGFNKLAGELPPSLAGLSSVQFLFLSNNNFSGRIPGWIGDLEALRALDFSFNNLTGEIPPDISRLKTLRNKQRYNASSPSASVHTPEGLTYQGFALPTTIDLSHNHLTGSIPDGFGALQNVQVLDLSDNNLSGSIPPILSNASSLLKLDLSYNRLGGNVPQTLSTLTFLAFLNLSFNQLTGQLPNSPQFYTFPTSSFIGNHLCGAVLNISCSQSPSPLPSFARSDSSKASNIGKVFAVCGAIVLCAFLVTYSALARRRQKLFSNGESCERQRISVAFSDKLPAKICPEQLAKATDSYSQANIVGDGGFGIVYRAVLETGAVVAVKKLSSGGVQGEREFHAELQTLGDLKHKNLVPLLGYCSDGNDKLLIYKYLKNGSLDTWLYCRENGMKALNWPTRLQIARGSAQGIAYLHQGGDHPSIIHRDIKVSNILLDEDFEAHVADFGLARLVDAGDTHVSTDVAGTIGYIPPEYNHKCVATTKGDVYSFGVVCLEILTGKRPTDQYFRKTGAGHLVGWILSMTTIEEHRMALDCTMTDEESCSSARSVDEMLDMMRLACICCREAPSRRPSMQEVASMLEKLERRMLAASAVAAESPRKDSKRCSIDHVELTPMS